MKSVFLSYRRSNGSHFAASIKASLASSGIQSFMDVSSQAPGNFMDRINAAIADSDIIIPVMTDGYFAERPGFDNTFYELKFALASGKKCIPVADSGFRFPDVMPHGLEAIRQSETCFYDSNNPGAFFEKLKQYIIKVRQDITAENTNFTGSVSPILAKFYTEAYRDAFRSTKNYLAELFCSLFSDTELLSLVSSNLMSSGTYFSVLPRKALLYNETVTSPVYILIQQLAGISGINDPQLTRKLNGLDNDTIRDIVAVKFPDGKANMDMLSGMIRKYTDEASVIKMCLFMRRNTPDLFQKLSGTFQPGFHMYTEMNAALKLRNNVLGHNNAAFIERLSTDSFIADLQLLKRIVSGIGSWADETPMAVIRQNTISVIDTGIIRASTPALPLASVYDSYPSVTEEYLKNSRIEKNIDWSRKMIYFTTMAELGSVSAAASLHIPAAKSSDRNGKTSETAKFAETKVLREPSPCKNMESLPDRMPSIADTFKQKEYSRYNLYELVKLADSGDRFAAVNVAIVYLQSSSQKEKDIGLKMLEDLYPEVIQHAVTNEDYTFVYHLLAITENELFNRVQKTAENAVYKEKFKKAIYDLACLPAFSKDSYERFFKLIISFEHNIVRERDYAAADKYRRMSAEEGSLYSAAELSLFLFLNGEKIESMKYAMMSKEILAKLLKKRAAPDEFWEHDMMFMVYTLFAITGLKPCPWADVFHGKEKEQLTDWRRIGVDRGFLLRHMLFIYWGREYGIKEAPAMKPLFPRYWWAGERVARLGEQRRDQK